MTTGACAESGETAASSATRGHTSAASVAAEQCALPEPSARASVATAPSPTQEDDRTPCCRCHCNSVWSVWYSLAVLGVTAMLLHTAALRFIDYTHMAWPENDRPFWELNAYIGLAGATVVLAPMFLVAGLFRLGNLANDGVTIGAHESTMCSHDTSLATFADSLPRRLWTHSGPTASLLHVIMSLLLLTPPLIMQAKLVHLGYLKENILFNSNFEMLFSSSSEARPSFGINSTFLLLAPIQVTPEDLLYSRIKNHFNSYSMPCGEILNFSWALIVYSIQYSACFWGSSKAFGMLFSIYNLGTAFVAVCAWDGFSILYRVQVLKDELPPEVTNTFILSIGPSVVLCLAYLTILISTTSILYIYGHQKYHSYLSQQKSRYQISLRSQSRCASFEYTAHCLALAFLLLCIVVGAPLVHDLAVVHRNSGSTCCLVAVAAIVLHLFVWVLLWLLLSVKHNWTFRLRVTVGNAYLRSAENIKLVYKIDLKQKRGDADAPMMLVENGMVSTLDDQHVRARINGLVESHRQGHRLKWQQEEQVYWHRPTTNMPASDDPDSAAQITEVVQLLDTQHMTEEPQNSETSPLKPATSSAKEDVESVNQHGYRYFPEGMDSVIRQCSPRTTITQPPATVNTHNMHALDKIDELPVSSDCTSDQLNHTVSDNYTRQQQLQQLQLLVGAEAERSYSEDTASSSGVHSGSSQMADLEPLPPPPLPQLPQQLLATPASAAGQLCSMSLQRAVGRYHTTSGQLPGHNAIMYGASDGGAGTGGILASAAFTLPPRLTATSAVATDRAQMTRLQHQSPLQTSKMTVPSELLHQLQQRQHATPVTSGPSPVYSTHPAPCPSDQGVRIDLCMQQQQQQQHIYGNTLGLVNLCG